MIYVFYIDFRDNIFIVNLAKCVPEGELAPTLPKGSKMLHNMAAHNMSPNAKNLSLGVCKQQRGRSACASDQGFVIHLLQSIISKLTTSKISILRKLV